MINREDHLFFNRGNEKKTLRNLTEKYIRTCGGNLTMARSCEATDNMFEKITNCYINNMDFIVVDQPVFILNYMEEKKSVPTITTKTISVKTIESSNYLWIMDELKSEMKLEENEDKELIVYEVSVFEDFTSVRLYGRDDLRAYKTRLRYAIDDIGSYSYLMDTYKRNKKRKDIADYYNPINAMSFKEYVIQERRKIQNQRRKNSISSSRIQSFESFMSGTGSSYHALNE